LDDVNRKGANIAHMRCAPNDYPLQLAS